MLAALGLAAVLIAGAVFFVMSRESPTTPVSTPSDPTTLLAEREPDRGPESLPPATPLPPAAATPPPAATPAPPPSLQAATATAAASEPAPTPDPSPAADAREGRGRAGRGAVVLGLAASLRGLPPQTYDLIVQADDPEARDMGEQLRSVLDAAGWTCASARELPVAQEGIAVAVPEPTPSATALVNWARRNGYAPAVRTMPNLPRIRIVIGGGRAPQ